MLISQKVWRPEQNFVLARKVPPQFPPDLRALFQVAIAIPAFLAAVYLSHGYWILEARHSQPLNFHSLPLGCLTHSVTVLQPHYQLWVTPKNHPILTFPGVPFVRLQQLSVD